MQKRNTEDDPHMKQVMQVMAWAWDNRKDKNRPVTIDFGYEDATTGKKQALRITLDESTHDIDEFGGRPDQADKKKEGDNKWGLGI